LPAVSLVITGGFLSPASYLESRGFRVKREGRHLSVRDGKEEVYRITEKEGGWVACDKNGRGIGDNIALVRHIDHVSFTDAVKTLGGGYVERETIRQPLEHRKTEQPEPERERPSLPLSRSVDQVAGRDYLSSRGISDTVIQRAEASGFVMHIGGGVAFVGRDKDGAIRSATKRDIDPNAAVSKRDFKGSDKSFPPMLKGNEASVWIVEGGVDALALHTMAERAGKAPPFVLVSGGANVRSFLDNPQVREVLKKAERITIACENEKDETTQAKTNEQHRRQADRVKEITGKDATLSRPPEGIKDLAEMNQRRLAGEKGQEPQKDQTLSPSASTPEREGERVQPDRLQDTGAGVETRPSAAVDRDGEP
jgi:hypothetical protein